jgi:hypothetical protein
MPGRTGAKTRWLSGCLNQPKEKIDEKALCFGICIFEKNVICAKGKIVLENPNAITTLRNNVLFSAESKVQSHKLKNYSRTGSYPFKAGCENLLVDPLLVEFDKGTVSFAGYSTALKLSINSIDVRGADQHAGGDGE